MNPYYNVSGAPANRSAGASATIRAEFAAIAAGFESLNNLVTINASGVQVLGSGHIGVGVAPVAGALYNGAFDSGAVTTGIQLTCYGTFAPSISQRQAGGTMAGPSATLIGSGALNIVGGTTSDGTTFFNTLAISGFAEATATPGSHPTYLAFSTTPAGSTTRVERVRITSAGWIGLGTSGPNRLFDAVGAVVSDGSLGSLIRIQSTAAYNAGPTVGISFANLFNSGGSSAGMGGIAVSKENAVDGDFGGYLSLYTRPNGGANTERLRITSTGVIQPGTTLAQDFGTSALEWTTLFTSKVQRSSAGTLEINSSNAAGIIELRTAGTSRMVLQADGRFGGFFLHNNATPPSGTVVQYIASGTYTPVAFTNLTNIAASTPRACFWIRVGNVVHVAGYFTASTTTAAGTTSRLTMSLPIATTLVGKSTAAGISTVDSLGASNASETGYAVPFGNDVEHVWSSANNSSHDHMFHLTYLLT